MLMEKDVKEIDWNIILSEPITEYIKDLARDWRTCPVGQIVSGDHTIVEESDVYLKISPAAKKLGANFGSALNSENSIESIRSLYNEIKNLDTVY